MITTAGWLALGYLWEACQAVETATAWCDFWTRKAREDWGS